MRLEEEDEEDRGEAEGFRSSPRGEWVRVADFWWGGRKSQFWMFGRARAGGWSFRNCSEVSLRGNGGQKMQLHFPLLRRSKRGHPSSPKAGHARNPMNCTLRPSATSLMESRARPMVRRCVYTVDICGVCLAALGTRASSAAVFHNSSRYLDSSTFSSAILYLLHSLIRELLI